MSITENRIHIYSTEDYSLKHCLGDDIIVERIKISIFSKKRNYVAFLFDNFTIQIFDLNYIIKSDNQICTCNATAKRRNSMNKLVKKHSYDHINKLNSLIFIYSYFIYFLLINTFSPFFSFFLIEIHFKYFKYLLI